MTDALPPSPEFGAPLPVVRSPEVLMFLARRRSAAALSLGAPGPTPRELDDLLRLAVRVPDHGKLAPWRFVVLEGAGKAAFAEALERLALERGEVSAAAKVGKLKAPPLAVAVISSPKAAPIPEWEQRLSAAAVCTTLAYASQAMGYGANWITDWYAYDPKANALLGVEGQEKVAGFILIGAPREPPLERERPDPTPLITRWRG